MIDDYTAARSRPPQNFLEPYVYGVNELIDRCNTLFSTEFDTILIEGEVDNFKINQGKWVFFDLKEGEQKVSCFMTLFHFTHPFTDGMKVRLLARPKLRPNGAFSLTVERAMPLGIGNLRKSFQLLRQKLAAEGLFDPARRRPLPAVLSQIGVISSTDAAGYADFIKILNQRWGGLKVYTAHTQVQGLEAPLQIIRAFDYFNQQTDVDLIVLIRGGGSSDDLAAFNDEQLVRTIAASRIPVLTGIGHEIDETLADLAADLRASTPSNAAELITPDKHSLSLRLDADFTRLARHLREAFAAQDVSTAHQIAQLTDRFSAKIRSASDQVSAKRQLLASLNPEAVLRRGYAIVRSLDAPPPRLLPGNRLEIVTTQNLIQAKVTHVKPRSSHLA